MLQDTPSLSLVAHQDDIKSRLAEKLGLTGGDYPFNWISDFQKGWSQCHQ
jgi:hypothetical protein